MDGDSLLDDESDDYVSSVAGFSYFRPPVCDPITYHWWVAFRDETEQATRTSTRRKFLEYCDTVSSKYMPYERYASTHLQVRLHHKNALIITQRCNIGQCLIVLGRKRAIFTFQHSFFPLEPLNVFRHVDERGLRTRQRKTRSSPFQADKKEEGTGSGLRSFPSRNHAISLLGSIKTLNREWMRRAWQGRKQPVPYVRTEGAYPLFRTWLSECSRPRAISFAKSWNFIEPMGFRTSCESMLLLPLLLLLISKSRLIKGSWALRHYSCARTAQETFKQGQAWLSEKGGGLPYEKVGGARRAP